MFLIKNVEHTSPWAYVTEDLDGKEVIGTFHEQELEKFRTEKVISCM